MKVSRDLDRIAARDLYRSMVAYQGLSDVDIVKKYYVPAR